ncbi:MAG: hypothetical protein VR70_08085 [Rhodospirillaceae bacterium BRH_c57]|nr:MAG: hypothetical protein VR70_08085 [Rhodospirillaceae bacterium BRH_c57]
MSVHQPDVEPEFPLEALGGIASEVSARAQASSVKIGVIAAILLVCAASLLGHTSVQVTASWREHVSLYLNLIMRPSGGKSRAIYPFLELLRRIEQAALPAWEDAMARFQAALLAAAATASAYKKIVKDAVESGQTPPEPPEGLLPPPAPAKIRTVSEDTTKAALLQMQIDGNSVLVYQDEARRDEGDLRALYLTAWNGGAYHLDRAHGGGSIKSIAVSILKGLQPDKVSHVFGGADDGYMSRFLNVVADPIRVTTTPPTLDTERLFSAFIALREFDGQTLDLSEDALACFNGWTAEHDAEHVRPHMQGHQGKVKGIAAQLAAILECLNRAWSGDTQPPSEISGVSMASALWIIEDFFKPMAHRAYRMVDGAGQNPTTELAAWIIATAPQTINARRLARGELVAGLNSARAQDAIADLIDAGWLRNPPHRSGPGRPSSDLEVNPKVLTACKENANV